MRLLRQDPRALDLDALPPDVRRAIEAAMTGSTVLVRRRGRELGSLTFRPAVLEGVVVAPAPPAPGLDVPEGVTVVATAMRLSESARRRLADGLGPDYLVIDMHGAPASTDVLLVNAVSPQLLGRLQDRFPSARVIVTEIDDEELGASYSGPVSRLLDAGAAAYLPPRDIGGVAAGVQAYLTGSGRQALVSAGPDLRPSLPAARRPVTGDA
jgi:hypothetical protein